MSRYKLRVEFPRGRDNFGSSSSSSYRGRPDSDRRPGADRGADRGGNKSSSRRSQYKVIVSGLPASGSWQDLKDHMREAGDVCYADVYKDGSGTGVVEFLREEDVQYAIKKLDDSRFRSHENEVSYIRIREGSASSSYNNESRKTG